jgi:hypothetical protein
MQHDARRHWPEAIVGVLGALPMAIIWLHVYSHTPPWHSEPTWSHTVVLVAAAAIGTVAAGWLLRTRLRLPWFALVTVALLGPVVVVASGVIRTRSAEWGDVTAPVVAALGAAAAYLLAAVAIAAVRVRGRLTAGLVPLALALAVGHVAYGLPGEIRVEIARSIGYPYPNAAASELLHGHTLES